MDLSPAAQDYSDESVWRPVAADFVGGDTAAVAVGQTVGVFDATLGSYRVFERQGSAVGERRVVEPGWPTMWAPIGSSCRCSSTATARSTWTSWARTRSGFFIEDAALGLVLASAQTSQSLPVNNQHRTKSFTALKATAVSAGLVGFEDAGFVFTVRDIVVEVNSGSPVLPGQVAPTIDWRCSFPLDPNDPGDRVGYEVETGDPDNPVLIDFRGTPLVGIAAAHVVLEIGDNVFVSGAFSFRMGEVETVTVEQGGLLPDITGLNVRTIKIGAEGVSVFLGDGLADYDIDADIADYLSTDAPAVVLLGETVGNLVDGKVYRRVGCAALDGPALDLSPACARIIRTSRSGGRWRPISWVATRRRSRSGRRSGCSTRRWAATACSSGRAAAGERRVVERWLADYVGADWVELSVFFNGDGTLNMDELGPDAVGLLYRGRGARFGVGVGADLAETAGQQPAQDEVVYGFEGDGGVGGAGRVRGRGLCVHGA